MRILLFSFALMAFVGCEQRDTQQKFQATGMALGTTYAITYLSDTPLDIEPAIDSVFLAVNKSMSTYLPQSDISRINQGDTTVVVDAMFSDVFTISQEVYKATNGYFDPTVGVLVDAWGFGPGQQFALDSTSVDSLLQFVGFNKVAIKKNGTVQKAHPSIRFDFNAVGKGYAIDRLAQMLRDKGLVNFIVEVGGEIFAAGENTISNKNWVVGIDSPNEGEQRGAAATMALKNRALASSGNYRKFRIDSLTGERFVHTIDPKTGFTKVSNVLATSVVAKDCATADAFATAFMAMDLEDSKAYLNEQKEIDAYLIYTDKDGGIATFMTEGFQSLLIQQAF